MSRPSCCWIAFSIRLIRVLAYNSFPCSFLFGVVAAAAVTLLDYGAGNVRSVRNAIQYLGFDIKDINGGCEARLIGAYVLAKAVEELGAGERLLNCIDCDGISMN